MDFQLTDEQRLIRDTVRDFAAGEVAPRAARRDEEQEFPADELREAADLGLLGLLVSEQYGGVGAGTVSYAVAVEELSRASAALGVIVSVNSLVCNAIQQFGSEQQKERYLPALATGGGLGCFALTEPDAGSDASNLSATARPDGQGYVLNGTKSFITSGASSTVAVVFAVTDAQTHASKHSRGISAFIVEKGTAGFSVGRKEDKLGVRASDTTQLVFDECHLPGESLLGRAGEGFHIALAALDVGRIGIAAEAVGIAQGALDAAVRYAKERVQFGQPIAAFQGLQWMLADMDTRIAAARLLAYQAADSRDRGRPFTRQSAMAKLFASETAMWVTTKAVQIHGGYGYIKEYAVERFFRDAKVTEIYEGTSEIQRTVIARHLLG